MLKLSYRWECYSISALSSRPRRAVKAARLLCLVPGAMLLFCFVFVTWNTIVKIKLICNCDIGQVSSQDPQVVLGFCDASTLL
ncbi:hypothetical protein IRJ41_004926 [Triplophysa rosa]|uniref:Uncharacterized protein n=1 Tax=Triplophysa rosa TaxID=992332 RepID=A0A9W7T2D0_TRIRA|nr:hypothetical protein IRJ41_004926 [Triplophysa rosa]